MNSMRMGAVALAMIVLSAVFVGCGSLDDMENAELEGADDLESSSHAMESPSESPSPTSWGTPIPIERVSKERTGPQADGPSDVARLSADGNVVAFHSTASNLGPYGTTYSDIFVHVRSTGVLTRITRDQGDSTNPSLSADGRYVAFESWTTNLVPGDTNATQDIFVHDRITSTTSRVSVATNGTQANNGSSMPAISGDGRFVVFTTWADNLGGGTGIYLRDRTAGTTTFVARGDYGAISSNGRVIAFSTATALVATDTNGSHDIYTYDRIATTYDRVNVSSTGAQVPGLTWGRESPSLSSDGRFVAFSWEDSALVPGDTNGPHDVFLRDRVARTTTRITLAANGAQPNNMSSNPSISGDGRFVTYFTSAGNLQTPVETNAAFVMVHDRVARTTARINGAGNTRPNEVSALPAISSDGRYVAFTSIASNLVQGDTNGVSDIFVAPNPVGLWATSGY